MKIVYVVLGCISLGIGAIGAVLPLLPAFPFLLLAAWCFAKSSKRDCTTGLWEQSCTKRIWKAM